MKKLLFLFALLSFTFMANAQSTLKGDMNDDGELSVLDVMKLVGIILGNVPQAYTHCPNENHPHMIDLGLPSGTKWACCNVGASAPEEYGGYYAWGETEEKEYYDWTSYLYFNDSQNTYWDLGNDIAGTQYDVAHVKWGGSWVMPSLDKTLELLINCSTQWTTINGVDGHIFTGPSGGTIFLPAAGYRTVGRLYDAGSGYYWSSTQYPSDSGYAYDLHFRSYDYWGEVYERFIGLTVRPVSR